MSNELGEYLRSLRGKRSLREIAALSNGELSHNVISTAEKGVGTHGQPYTPSAEKLKVFARIYNVPAIKLLSMAGYTEEAPGWATEEEIVEIESILDEKTEMTVGGEVLPPDKAQQVRNILRGALYEELERMKKQRK